MTTIGLPAELGPPATLSVAAGKSLTVRLPACAASSPDTVLGPALPHDANSIAAATAAGLRPSERTENFDIRWRTHSPHPAPLSQDMVKSALSFLVFLLAKPVVAALPRQC